MVSKKMMDCHYFTYFSLIVGSCLLGFAMSDLWFLNHSLKIPNFLVLFCNSFAHNSGITSFDVRERGDSFFKCLPSRINLIFDLLQLETFLPQIPNACLNPTRDS